MEELGDLQEGDRILFNDRKMPLTVQETEKDSVLVEGPNGGRVRLFRAEETDDVLYCRPGNRDYASYLENLRKTGRWKKNSRKIWTHTGSGADLKLVKNEAGFWTVQTQDFNENLDLPKYGFSSREDAEEKIHEIMEKYPEGGK